MVRFLLAKFQLDHILSPREPRKRLEAISTVPKDMFAAYNGVMQRIENSGDTELALKILSWLFRARRPLHMEELREALVLQLGDEDLNHEFMIPPAEIVECCKSLLVHEESSGLVRFTHYTVQRFIADKIHQKLPPISDLAKTCAAYLSLPEFT